MRVHCLFKVIDKYIRVAFLHIYYSLALGEMCVCLLVLSSRITEIVSLFVTSGDGYDGYGLERPLSLKAKRNIRG